MFKGTTIVGIKKDNLTAVSGDGQITMGETAIMKATAVKVRKIYNDKVIVGFAGSVADAMTLAEMLEEKLEEYGGNLKRASVELAKLWRRDKMLRKLEALLIAVDEESMLLVSGSGEVIEAEEGVIAIGSGGNFALSAGKALLKHSSLDAKEISIESIKIAASICVYTNDNITTEVL